MILNIPIEFFFFFFIYSFFFFFNRLSSVNDTISNWIVWKPYKSRSYSWCHDIDTFTTHLENSWGRICQLRCMCIHEEDFLQLIISVVDHPRYKYCHSKVWKTRWSHCGWQKLQKSRHFTYSQLGLHARCLKCVFVAKKATWIEFSVRYFYWLMDLAAEQ